MEDETEDGTGIGGLVLLILTAGALLGIHLATRKTPHERKLEETARLIEEEARRLRKPIDPEHVRLALRRFDEGQLEIFNRYVKAVIHRDLAAWEAMQPEWRARIMPVLSNAPEWREYTGIIIGG